MRQQDNHLLSVSIYGHINRHLSIKNEIKFLEANIGKYPYHFQERKFLKGTVI